MRILPDEESQQVAVDQPVLSSTGKFELPANRFGFATVRTETTIFPDRPQTSDAVVIPAQDVPRDYASCA